MKRARFLWPLTQGYHRGLVAARNILERMSLLIQRPNPTQSIRLQQEVLVFWEKELRDHFAAEEEMLRTLAQHLSANDPAIQRTFKEHHRMKELAISGNMGDLKAFAELLRDHIRFEEEVLFGKIEKVFTEAEAEQQSLRLREKVPPCGASSPVLNREDPGKSV